MSTTIAGHILTNRELEILHEVTDYMRESAGDSGWQPNTSPVGDGRWVPLMEIYPARDNRDNARRQTVRRLHQLGVLKACQVAFHGDCIKGVSWTDSEQWERIENAKNGEQLT